MRQGLDAMLEGLDPFTNYISETDIEGYRIQTDGKYNGVGAEGQQMGDWVVDHRNIRKQPRPQSRSESRRRHYHRRRPKRQRAETKARCIEFLRGFPGTQSGTAWCAARARIKT
ncbi:MAG: hypothetical protein V9F82_07455 [Dermatophilaceae bacterium]